MDKVQFGNSKYKSEIKELHDLANSMRQDKDFPQDVSIFKLFEEKHPGETTESLFEDLGINPEVDTINNIATLPDVNVRWILPEIFMSAIRLGLRKGPIFPNIIASEQPLSQMRASMPFINMSDADLRYVNEGETIQFGGISYGSKDIKVRKMGRGMKLTYEVRDYSTLNVLNIFLQDFGVRMGYGMDSLAIDCLLNGEQADGSASAPVIGVKTVSTLVYRDLTKIWVRLSRMGKTATTMIAGENIAIDLLNLPEYKQRFIGTPYANLDVKTPIPQSASVYIHGSIPANQIVILDPATTMIKFNAKPLLIESEKVVSNQTEAIYCSLTTGFASMFRDSRVVVDQSLDIATHDFPSYMNVDVLEISTIK